MSECLVTVLKDTVDDDSLMKLGEFKIHVNVPASFTQPALGMDMTQWPHLGDVNMKIVGNGYFTDSTGTQNYGKTYTKPTSGNTAFYLSKGEYDLIFDNKYEIRRLNFSQQNNTEVNLSDLEFMPIKQIDMRYINVHGDISNVTKQSDLQDFSVIGKKKADITGNLSVFADKTSLDTLWIQDTDIKGSISSLAGCTALTQISIARTAINGDISALSGMSALQELWVHGSAVSGNVSALSNLTALVKVSFQNTNVRGNLSSFANLTNLVWIVVDGTNIGGDISSLRNLTKLVRLDVGGTNIGGDTSSLRNLTNLTVFNYANTAITGTWPLT